MKSVRTLLSFLCVYLVGGFTGVSNTSGTPESITIQNLRLVFELFEKDKGVPPTNWLQVEEFFSLQKINDERLKGTSIYPLQQHYVFVLDKIPMLGYQEGEVFLIRAEPSPNPIRENKVGRYIISKTEDGLKFNWYSEEKVQQMLAKAGVTELPKPEPWVPRTNNAAQPPVLQSSNLLVGTSPSPKIRPSADFSNGTPQADLQAEPEPVQIAQTSPSKTWKGIAVAAVVVLLLGWIVARRAQKRRNNP